MYKPNLVFAAACIGMFLFGMVFLSLGTIAVFIQEKYQVDAVRVASLASSLPFGILLGSLFFGPIVDRYSYKLLLITCTGLIMVAFEIIAYAGTFRVLQLSYFLIGFAGGVINGATNALSADITSELKGAKLSLLGVFFGIGALGMPLVIGSLSRNYSYQAIISVIGFIAVLPVIFFSVIRFPEAKQKQGFPLQKAVFLLKDPLIILIGFILFFESALEGMINNWSTSFLKTVDLSEQNALYALSCQVAAIAVARLALSRLLRQIPSRIMVYIGFAFIFAGILILFFVSSFPQAVFSMICLGIGFAAGFPVVLGYVGELYSEISGTAFSIVIVMALTGNTLLNYLAGILSKLHGMGSFPVLLAVCVLLMAFLFRLAVNKISKKIKT
jgi:MFS transporter, FHS family, glucose/mannose:H+ symporter